MSRFRLKPLPRAILTDDGVLIKSQNANPLSFHSNALRDPDAGPDDKGCDDGTHERGAGESMFCLTCLSDSTNFDSNGRGILPMNTVIPYGRIINAHNVRSLGATQTTKKSKQDTTISTALLANDDDGLSMDLENDAMDYVIDLVFVLPLEKNVVPRTVRLNIDYVPLSPASSDLAEVILKRSYKNARRNKKMLVIINPFGGKGQAKNLFFQRAAPILDASGSDYDIAYTERSRHAVEIAESLDIDKYDTIVCASGDGIPYEVLNGLYRRIDRVAAFNKIVVTQLPCGSGNAMSISCHWTMNTSYAALCLLKSQESRIDVMCCQQPSYSDQPRLSFLSQTYGIIAESDINTEFIRWMGPIRFNIGVAFNLLQGKTYACDVYVKYAAKTKHDMKVHYLLHKKTAELIFDSPPASSSSASLSQSNPLNEHLQSASSSSLSTPPTPAQESVISSEDFNLKYSLSDPIPEEWERLSSDITDNLSIFYTGKMPYIADKTKFFPAALPADGAIDLVIMNSTTSVRRMTPILLSLDDGTHVMQPEVLHSKVSAFRLVPHIEEGLISVDGEKFPLEPMQVEVLPSLVKTLLRNGSYIDTEFDTLLST
ncbi:sphinganine kinase LCB4 KNAG_0M01110 [Huiozyma naganishii CBS 8797]|uniref:sphingosine kinase n=1 Tax=Huiozyma naganishii (strain ATCC MYA-139 / BCRC 22969 / CBS 8797 / KCTC 17520 / NBRC 10181 / NCYC 3082 / Yp74L-3) TaxID=1071383 RepID=J7SAR8_HUIN7|nr:hypothetical protein KNAG_0M01110 [Kazachstania naganishii CBS 8797]CCK72964.1 hypothetical protein KNAG_0M01110 [Kazachstania naganishii CBS 8797]